MIKNLRHLVRDTRAAAAVEFALLGPIILTLMFGVLQVGMLMQNYDALRNVASDVSRYAMIQYDTGNMVSNPQLAQYAISTAEGTPYLLENSRLNAQVVDSSTQQVSGAKELTLTITYKAATLLKFVGIGGPYMTYTQRIFLVCSTCS